MGMGRIVKHFQCLGEDYKRSMLIDVGIQMGHISVTLGHVT